MTDNLPQKQYKILLYHTEDDRTRIEGRLLNEGELGENRVIKEYLTTARDGKNCRTKFCNLESIAIGHADGKTGTTSEKTSEKKPTANAVSGHDIKSDPCFNLHIDIDYSGAETLQP